ncbi:MAG: PEP-CTERM sorting domain-containing protein [Thiobacillus sp.]|nr:PEP-CTERM sorting domain-containing protein [Thiobacillus sp.]
MKNKTNSIRSIVSASALGMVMGVAMAGNASAAFIACSGTGYDINDKVPTATDCTILGPLNGHENDTLNPTMLVNDEAFFGISDWLFDGKWNEEKNLGFVDTSDLFDFTGDGQSGSFSYVGGASIADIMFIFKGGEGTNLVGYLVTQADGIYATPFTNLPFPLTGNSAVKDTSHISVYYRNGEGSKPRGQIPEPGVLLLVGVGLMGLGLARRRKSA